MKNSDRQNARIEYDNVLKLAVNGVMKDHTQFFKLFCDDPDFRRWVSDTVFDLTYEGGRAPPADSPASGGG